jgi:hypothetical protein
LLYLLLKPPCGGFFIGFLPAEPGKFSETGAIKALFVERGHVLLCHVF